jgi:hypothetical protein
MADFTPRKSTPGNGGNGDPPGVAKHNDGSTMLVVYPNPVINGQLTVENEQWQAGEAIEIYSLSGALVAKYKTTGEQTLVNVSQLAKGVYVVKVGGRAGKMIVSD